MASLSPSRRPCRTRRLSLPRTAHGIRLSTQEHHAIDTRARTAPCRLQPDVTASPRTRKEAHRRPHLRPTRTSRRPRLRSNLQRRSGHSNTPASANQSSCARATSYFGTTSSGAARSLRWSTTRVLACRRQRTALPLVRQQQRSRTKPRAPHPPPARWSRVGSARGARATRLSRRPRYLSTCRSRTLVMSHHPGLFPPFIV